MRPLDPEAPGATSSLPVSEAFASLGLAPTLLSAVAKAGYTAPTPIQSQAIPPVLDGRDVLGCAQTGTGKTAAFVLPLLQRLAGSSADMDTEDAAPQTHPRGQRRRHRRGPKRVVRALIMAPTRELAAQIGESIEVYGSDGDLRHTVIFGGVKQRPQEAALARGLDIIVATPGRLLDLMGQGLVSLDDVRHLIIDEFDRMLDQGFWPTIRRIVEKVPQKRQTLLFSATMPDELTRLVDQLTHDRVEVSVAPAASTPDLVDQQVRLVERAAKRRALEGIVRDSEITRALVFTRTKHGANRVARQLSRGGVDAEVIHGNKSQNARERALGAFREGKLRILVATDLAARGIDVDDVSHVINFDLPMDAESYVHRIGRTARAGRCGQAISFCSSEEREQLRRIERLIDRQLPLFDADGDETERPEDLMPRRRGQSPRGAKPAAPRQPGNRSRRGRTGGRGRGRATSSSSGRPRSSAQGQQQDQPQRGARTSDNSGSRSNRSSQRSEAGQGQPQRRRRRRRRPAASA